MRGRDLGRLYPLLFAILPLVQVVAYNPGQSRLTNLGILVIALWGAFGLLYLLVGWALRGRDSASLTQFVVLGAVAWFYLNPLAEHLIERVTGARVSPLVPIPLGLLIAAGILVWLERRPRVRDGAQAVLTTMGSLLMAWSVITIGMNEMRARHDIATSALVADLAAPVKAGPTTSTSIDKPDIYLIVLDEYANSAVQRELFGSADQEFEDSLRTLGFTIPKLVRSNYTQTMLSIPSLLNFAYINRLTAELGAKSKDRTLPAYLVENNRAVRFLQARGYRFVFFPSQWWRATDHNRHADREFRIEGRPSLRRALAASELSNYLWRYTLLGTIGSLESVQAEYIRRTFDGIRELTTGETPTFVFAHLIFPHEPYILNARCEPRVGPWQGDPDRRYLHQVRCANVLILDLVTTLLRRPGRPRIILLQGDHGTEMRGYSTAPTARLVTPAQARERFGAFGAYYLPGGAARLFTDTVTIVNVFRKVFSYYFAADLPPMPDHLYMSVEPPFDFVEVDPATLD